MPDPNAEPNPEAPLAEKAASEAAAPVASESTSASSEAVRPNEPAAPAVPAASAKSGGGILEWFWQANAVKALHARGTTLTPRGQELLRRARLAHELGGRVLEPPEPLPSGNGDALASELYRESVEWSLAAHQEQGRAAPGAADRPASVANSRDLGLLWDAADPAFLNKAASKGADLSKLREDLVGKNYRDFAELDSAEQGRLARSLRLFAENLTTTLDSAQSELDRIWLRRLVRVGALLALIGALVIVISKTVIWAEGGKDLAGRADWSASSLYSAEPGCPAPSQECAGSPNFFIHTNEEQDPWLMFDMKSPTSLSAVRVDNRLDCCYERAIPLIIEVSDDGSAWKEVARRTSDFSSWKAEFPTVKTRYVRLRINKRTNLHFSRVRLLP